MKIKKIKPMFTSVVTTMNVYEEDTTKGGIIDVTKSRGTVKEYQEVLAVGSTVKDIKVGDIVCINPARFAVKKHREGSLREGVVGDNPVIAYNFPVIELDSKPCLLLRDQDIDFIIEDYEEVPDPTPSNIVKPDTNIVV